VAGGVAGLTIHADEPRSYTATARVVLDAPDPTSETESQSIADTARAIVTSPSLVERALVKTGARRPVIPLAEERIAVEPVGTSGILEIAVTDPDPRVAAELANRLTEDLILTRLRTSRGPLDEALSRVEERIAQLEASLEVLNEKIAAALSIEAQLQLSREKDLIIQRLVILEQKRSDLLTTQAQRPTPQIIDPARPPVEPDPSRQLADVALGGLLGLALAIGVVVIMESVRPTVVGERAVARELDAPVLGVLPAPPDYVQGQVLDPLASWIWAAAKSSGVQTVALMSTRRGDTLERLAEALAQRVNGAGKIEIRSLEQTQSQNGSVQKTVGDSKGVVVVTPQVVHKGDLTTVLDLFRVTGGQLIGAIAYRRSGRAPIRRRRRLKRA
jgi:uncharacterized protein involved in exopolysaccharide biosynthesis